MKQSGNWIAIIGATVAVAIVAAVSVWNWDIVGNSGIDLNGWIALILGVLATLAVGVGLMALIFISNRRGYDEPPGTDAGKNG
ncbi:MAG TPA: hypothetical protein VNV38_08895 [Stellaceae bacterium]|nr:hypothetical protein [Stellaceae bacterium]